MKKFFLLLLVLWAAGVAEEPAPKPSLAIGKAAPDFTLPVAGKKESVSLKATLKKHPYTVIMFISTRCPYCQGYNGRKKTIAEQFGPKGVGFIGINSNKTEPEDEVAKHTAEHQLPFPVLKDADNKVADLYLAERTPEIFVVNAKGLLVYHGRIDENYQDETKVESPDLISTLNELLSGKELTRKETKAFGCSIKRI